MMQQSVLYTISDFFCLKVQGLFLEKFFSSSFTVVLSSECLHALDLGLGGSLFGMSVLALLK